MIRHRGLMIFVSLMIVCPVSKGERVESNKQKQLKQMQQQIKKVDEDMASLRTEKSRLVSQLATMEKQYGQIAYSVKQLQADIEERRNVLQSIVRKTEQAQKTMQTQKKGLESLVRSAHAMGDKERLKVIFNQQDPALSSRMLIYYDYLNKARLEKLKAVEKNFLILKQLEQDKRRETNELNNTLTERRNEKIALEEVRKARKALLTRLDQQYTNKKNELDKLKGNEKKLRQILAAIQRRNDAFPFQEGPVKPFSQLKGQLPWPLKGRLIKRFGSHRSESRWDGVLITAKEGTEIHAVTRGRVVYADWLRGYGLLTIIDHGKGFMTLYAFNQSLYKVEGDWVEAGDVIASVGNSGGRSQSALYFGIRKNGKPVDPLRWCRKIRLDRVG